MGEASENSLTPKRCFPLPTSPSLGEERTECVVCAFLLRRVQHPVMAERIAQLREARVPEHVGRLGDAGRARLHSPLKDRIDILRRLELEGELDRRGPLCGRRRRAALFRELVAQEHVAAIDLRAMS